jgi:hypothetical protein
MKTVFHTLQNVYEYLEKLGPSKSLKIIQNVGYKRVNSLTLKLNKDRIINLAATLTDAKILDL